MVKNIANTTKILGKHLKRLSKEGLRSFIEKFCELDPPPGIIQIQIKDLEGKNPVEVVEMIMKFYTVRHAPKRVITALQNINENQIRMDLQKELRADGVKKKEIKKQIKVENDTWMSSGPVIATGQQMNAGASSQPGGDSKPKRGRKPKTAPGPSGGPAVAAGQQMNVGASPQPGGDNKPKRVRKPKAAPGPSGGPAVAAGQQMNVGASPQPGGDNKPKRVRKPKAAPGPSGGPVVAAGQQMNVGASPQPGGDNKPKRVRKPKAAPGPSDGSAIVEGQQMNVGASPQPGGDNKPKRARKPKADEEEHFVIANRTSLIKSITNIDPVLDVLLDKKLLTEEEYDRIRKNITSQDKMRELYNCVRSWGNGGKDILLKILEKNNSDAIKTLLEKSKRKK